MNNTHTFNLKKFGKQLNEAENVIIMLHGRGGDAEDLVHSLNNHLSLDGMAILAPQATNHTWYPYSFMAPQTQNEPWLSSALNIIQQTVEIALAGGKTTRNLFFLGFSQGACLMLEYVAQHAATYKGIFAYTGGLIGDKIYPKNYAGNFHNTPVLLGCSDVDPHVPLQRVYATENILKDRGAQVHLRVYPDMGHTINGDEIELTNRILSGGQQGEEPIK